MASEPSVRDFRALIADRRDGRSHSREELNFLARGAADGGIPDYQLSAWLMAAYLNPLSLEETRDLTLAMAESGGHLDLSTLRGPHLDKHSTGGVGDKTTIVLLPLLAACGLTIVKMSGAGLGITGGTVDKLLSIPGFEVDLSPERMVDQARDIGLALSAQTSFLAPADKALYALRDATETTGSIPLIVSSILSKKIAGGAKLIALDVKCGSGAFMTDLASAKALRDALVEVGTACGLRIEAKITDMSQPLGSAVGNGLEVEEALQVLADETLPSPTRRFRDLCAILASKTLVAAGVAGTEEQAAQMVDQALASGLALQRAEQWIDAQGGPSNIGSVRDAIPKAVHRLPVVARNSGYLHRLDARTVGEIVIELGGGRKTKSDLIDHSVGIVVNHFVSSPVREGETIAIIHANDRSKGEAMCDHFLSGVLIGDQPCEPVPVILG